MSVGLYVSNLASEVTEAELFDIFGAVGACRSVRIATHPDTGRSRGFAFIEMATPADAEKAISMFHQKDFQGRPLTVNEARPREERPPGQRFTRGPGGGGGGERRYGGGGGGGGYRDRH